MSAFFCFIPDTDLNLMEERQAQGIFPRERVPAGRTNKRIFRRDRNGETLSSCKFRPGRHMMHDDVCSM